MRKYSADFATPNGIKSIYIGEFISFNSALRAAKDEAAAAEWANSELVGVRLRVNGEFAPWVAD